MFFLKIPYAALALTAFLLFNVLCFSHKAFYGFINVSLLLLSPLGYIYPNAFSYALFALSWLVLYPASVFIYKVDPVNSFFPVFVFNCLLFGFLAYKKMIYKDKGLWDAELKKKEDEARRLSSELGNLNSIEASTRERELAIVSLYEVTKKMSASLTFDDIFKVFTSFLKDNFMFKRCDFIVLNWEDQPVPGVGDVYSVLHDETAQGPAGSVAYDKLMKLMLANPRELGISRDVNAEIFDKLDIKDAGTTALAAIPLISENRVAAILAVENLPAAEVEKFRILAMQFALEIKKILLYETVEKLAITDSLTGLYARRYFFERLNEEAQRSNRYKFKFAFLMSDIDDFKQTNDTYGHLVGDVVLKEIGRIMKTSVREIDLISRYGGEEFALILPETGLDGARLVAERIRKKIEETVFKAYDENVKVTISIGIAIYPKDAEKIKALVEKADKALYTAKKSGKNVVCEYNK